jgi:molybdate transport system ATP-binding protein
VDRVTRRRLQAELIALRRRLSLPVVLVTHDLEEAAMLADRMCLLHRGRSLQTAPPAEMLARPASAEVARLLDLRNLFRGVVEGHDGGAGVTFLRWGGWVLEAAHAPGFAPGAAVDWLAPASHLVLHRRDRPSRGERENPVGGRVVELLRFGEAVQITLDVGDPDGGTIALSMPAHVAARNGLAEGERATISILREGLHLIPQEGRSPTR